MLGLSKDTLRYYDRIGIVSPSRKDNRYRRYSRDDLIDLMNIQIMRYADFSLDEIKDKFGFRKIENVDSAYCEEVAVFLDEKNAAIRKKISDVHKGKALSEEHRQKISAANKGKPLPAECRLNKAKAQSEIGSKYRTYKSNGGTMTYNEFRASIKKSR